LQNVLHIIDTTGPGGAETVFVDLVSRLPQDKYRSVVIIQGKGWVHDELVRRGFSPFVIKASGSFNWRYLLSIIKIIKNQKIDIIQSHLLGSNVYSSIAGLICRRPVIATFHGGVDIHSKERFLALKFAALNLGANAVVAVSESLKQEIIARTPIKARKVTVIYNGIDTESFHKNKNDSLRKNYGWDSKDIIVGCLGNIRPAKGYDVLLSAAALLKNNPVRFRFVIAGQGKGSLFEKLQRQRTEQMLEENVHFVGFQNDPSEFLSNLDIFLLASTSEGFSIATIQAMASGLPVIVTRSGGPQEIVMHEQTGLMVEPGNPEQIAQALITLSDNHQLFHRIAQAGNEHAIDTFGIEKMLDAYQKLYQANKSRI